MGKKYIITRLKDDIVAGIYDNSEFTEITVSREDASKLNNIYVGRVENVVKNINCAFIEIEKGLKCYYSIDDNNHIFLNRKNSDKVCMGDLILVQVSKEAVKTKPPTVTCDINLSGKYVVLSKDASSVFVSNKIRNNARIRELKSLLEPLITDNTNATQFGYIVRTNAEFEDNDVILQEALRLKQEFLDIVKVAQYRPAFTVLHKSEPEYIEDIKGIKTETLDSIVTDDEDIHCMISEYLNNNYPGDIGKLVLYKDKLLPLNKLYSVESTLKSALNEKVWLKSGGYIIIQPTEALTVIDVNTGKSSVGKKAKEDSFLKINLEAAMEISKQLRLRNISGIIVVDFINQENSDNNKILISEISRLLKQDPIPAAFIEMTKLGLVEITRKKIKKPLYETCRKEYL